MFDLCFYKAVLNGFKSIMAEQHIKFMNNHEGYLNRRDNITVKRNVHNYNKALTGDLKLVDYFQIYLKYFDLEVRLLRKIDRMRYNISFE